MKEARPTTVEERIQIAKDCIANDENYGETALKYNVSYWRRRLSITRPFPSIRRTVFISLDSTGTPIQTTDPRSIICGLKWARNYRIKGCQ